jgi:hypothetical protein
MARRRGWQGWLLGLAFGAALLAAGGTRAADANAPAGSLRWVPANAAFYSAMLRNREQLDAILNSRAWARLKGLPAVQMGLQLAQAQMTQPAPQVAPFLEMAQKPENQQLLALLGDMFSDEVFCYGGDSFIGFSDLLMQLMGTQRYGPALAQLQGQGDAADQGKLQARLALRTLTRNLNEVRIPDLVLGFKLSKTEPAVAQLKRLEDFLNAAVEQAPPLKGRFKRAKLAGGDFLTLTLDGSLVPWERLPIGDLEEKEGEFAPLVKRLQELKLALSLGVRDGYLLVALGESTAALERLHGDRSLADRDELKPLAAHAGRRLTSIAYASRELREKLATTGKDVEGFAGMAKTLLDKADLTKEQRDKIRKQLDDLAHDIASAVPRQGATLAFSFLSERGSESYAYDWSEHFETDSSKPLTLLDHVGGSPLFAFVTRGRYSPEQYQKMVEWIKRGYHTFAEVALPKLDEAQREKAEQFSKALLPFFDRLGTVTGDLLLPALADSQGAFVLDARLMGKQFHEKMPPAEQPLPMLEPALVFGVTDADKLRRAMGEYRSIFNEVVAKLHEMGPDKVPDFQLPEPQIKAVKEGTLYFYPIPPAVGLDRRIEPNAGLANHVAALTITERHTERLLARHPLKTDGGPLADPKRHMAAAAYCDCEGIVRALIPWVEYGVRTAVRQRGEEGEDAAKKLDAILSQVRTGLEVFQVFRVYTSATYTEGGAQVTHSELVVRDL